VTDNKWDFFDLPILKARSPDTDTFVAQVFFCGYAARTPEECEFFVSYPAKRKPGTPRPKCPDHPEETASWANIYNVTGTEHRYYP